jgi:glycosyltransferase involved in cell wall biosynthesis
VRRLLHIFPFPPRLDAKDGGVRIAAELVTRLARSGNPTSIAHLWTPSEEAGLDDSVKVECDRVIWKPRRPAYRPPAAAAVALAARGEPLAVNATKSAEFADNVAELVLSWKPDLAYVHRQLMGQYVAALGGLPRVLIAYEAGSARALDEARGAPTFKRRLAKRGDLHAWRRYERHLLRSFDAVVAFTEPDRHSLLELEDAARVETIGFGTVVPEHMATDEEVPNRVLFVGNFAHRPNLEAAVLLATRIMPLVRAGVPDAHLFLVGAHRLPEVEGLASDSVTVRVDVEDVAPFWASAAVVALPLRTGAGMRVKALDAFGAGKAVVANDRAVAGAAVELGMHFVHAETDEEFARAIVELLMAPARRRELGDAARAWALEFASWGSVVERYEALQEELLADPQAADNSTPQRSPDDA